MKTFHVLEIRQRLLQYGQLLFGCRFQKIFNLSILNRRDCLVNFFKIVRVIAFVFVNNDGCLLVSNALITGTIIARILDLFRLHDLGVPYWKVDLFSNLILWGGWIQEIGSWKYRFRWRFGNSDTESFRFVKIERLGIWRELRVVHTPAFTFSWWHILRSFLRWFLGYKRNLAILAVNRKSTPWRISQIELLIIKLICGQKYYFREKCGKSAGKLKEYKTYWIVIICLFLYFCFGLGCLFSKWGQLCCRVWNHIFFWLVLSCGFILNSRSQPPSASPFRVRSNRSSSRWAPHSWLRPWPISLVYDSSLCCRGWLISPSVIVSKLLPHALFMNPSLICST